MFGSQLIALTLMWLVTLNPSISTKPTMSLEQKIHAISPFMSRVTNCVRASVEESPRFDADNLDEIGGDLITKGVIACIQPVQALIDKFDDFFGEGEGNAFFMGPYLKKLPELIFDVHTKKPQ